MDIYVFCQVKILIVKNDETIDSLCFLRYNVRVRSLRSKTIQSRQKAAERGQIMKFYWGGMVVGGTVGLVAPPPVYDALVAVLVVANRIVTSEDTWTAILNVLIGSTLGMLMGM